MFATIIESTYKPLVEGGADGMVDMWDSKSHAARHASSSLALPTSSIKTVDKYFVADWKTLCRLWVVLCRPETIVSIDY